MRYISLKLVRLLISLMLVYSAGFASLVSSGPFGIATKPLVVFLESLRYHAGINGHCAVDILFTYQSIFGVCFKLSLTISGSFLFYVCLFFLNKRQEHRRII